MGNAVSSYAAEHPVYIATPLVCLSVCGYTLYKSQSWDSLEPSTTATLVHLASLCLGVGAYTWHHAFTRPCISEALPAETSSPIERSLLRHLSMLSMVTSTLCLTSFLTRHPFWELDGFDLYQVYFLTVGVISSATNTLVFIPWASHLQANLNETEDSEKEKNQKNLENSVKSDLWQRNEKRLRTVALLGTLTGHLGYFSNMAYLAVLAYDMREL